MGQPPAAASPVPDPRVVAAIDALSYRELTRLDNYARLKMGLVSRTVRVSEWKDLVQEAFLKTLYRERPWNPDARHKSGYPITLTDHLIGCMRSIVDGWYKKESRHVSLHDEHASEHNLEAEKIAEIDAESNIRRLRAALEDDTEALELLEYLETDEEAEQLEELETDKYMDGSDRSDFFTGFRNSCRLFESERRYWATRKRILRRAHRLFRSEEEREK